MSNHVIIYMLLLTFYLCSYFKEVLTMKKYPMSARSELLVKKVFVYGFTWREVEDFFLINRTFLYDELKNYFLKMPDSEERLRRFDEKIKENEKNKEKTSISIILDEQERERG